MFSKKKSRELTKTFTFYEPKEIIWRFLVAALNEIGWRINVDAIGKGVFTTTAVFGSITLHVDVVSFSPGSFLELSFQRKNVGSQRFLFQLTTTGKSGVLLTMKTSMDFFSDDIDKASFRSTAKRSFKDLAKTIDEEIRVILEAKGLRAYF